MKYKVILADPPWTFRDRGSRISPDHEGRRRGPHYSTLPLQDIKAMGKWVSDIADPDAFLYLWVPTALKLQGYGSVVARSWAFDPCAEVIWVKLGLTGKLQIGMGHYTRGAHETMLICKRGQARVAAHNVPSVMFGPRGPHSTKPSIAYDYIERLCPDGPYLELFARKRYSSRWDVWGDGEDVGHGIRSIGEPQ